VILRDGTDVVNFVGHATINFTAIQQSAVINIAQTNDVRVTQRKTMDEVESTLNGDQVKISSVVEIYNGKSIPIIITVTARCEGKSILFNEDGAIVQVDVDKSLHDRDGNKHFFFTWDSVTAIPRKQSCFATPLSRLF